MKKSRLGPLRSLRRPAFALLLFGGIVAAAPSGRVYRIKDINTTALSTPNPRVASAVAGDVLYLTFDGALWTSDGTPEGTQPLPGMSGASFSISLDGVLYFVGFDDNHGQELWRSDGTRDGTRLLRDIFPGTGNSGIGRLVTFRHQLFFFANDGAHGLELWRTDGTTAGTVLVTDLTPGPASSHLVILGPGANALFFSKSTSDPKDPSLLYATDGTDAGTRPVRQFGTPVTGGICAGSCFGWPPGSFVPFAGRTYFLAGELATGLELWTTDGTAAGTSLVKDICPGPCSSFAWSDGESAIDTPLLQEIGGQLVFFADDGVHGREPWVSDGTEAGTRLVKDVFPGSSGSSYGIGMTRSGSSFFFGAADDANSWALWRSDGTEAGTFPVTAKNAISGSGLITPVGDTVYFVAGPRLWKTDSSGSPASIVTDAVADPTALVSFGGALYFTAAGSEGFSLWRSDGTAAGTSVVRVLSRPDGSSSYPNPMGVLDGSLLFFASDAETRKLWKTDGTEAGTQSFAAVGFGGGLEPAGWVAPFRGSLFFAGDDGVHGSELWRTDGTAEGTLLVKDIIRTDGSYPRCLTPIGDSLYFGAYSEHGSGLWKTDGTEAGTVFLKSTFLLCSGNSAPAVVPFNGLAYFSAGFPSGLWRTDGTSDGTQLVRSLQVVNLTSLGGRLIFAGGYPEGNGLWESNGTKDGTRIVQSFSGAMSPFVPLGDALVFFAADGNNRIMLMRTDGTASGTTTLADFGFYALGWGPVAAAGGRVFFAGQDSEHGVELWTSDGTTAGTHLVRDISDGAGSSYPKNFFAVGDHVLFSARDPIHGEELWRSDGTAKGTELVQDIFPGNASSLPANFTRAGSLVYFTADDGVTGIELWAIPTSLIESAPFRHPPEVNWRR